MRIKNVMWDQNRFALPALVGHLPDKMLKKFRDRMRMSAYMKDVVTWKFDKEYYEKTGVLVKIE